jgi:hypothetical protein
MCRDWTRISRIHSRDQDIMDSTEGMDTILSHTCGLVLSLTFKKEASTHREVAHKPC